MEYIATGMRNNIANGKSIPVNNMPDSINKIRKRQKINFRNMVLVIR
jgi:hypothetical protein